MAIWTGTECCVSAVAVATLSEIVWLDRIAFSILQAIVVHATDRVLHQDAYQWRMVIAKRASVWALLRILMQLLSTVILSECDCHGFTKSRYSCELNSVLCGLSHLNFRGWAGHSSTVSHASKLEGIVKLLDRLCAPVTEYWVWQSNLY